MTAEDLLNAYRDEMAPTLGRAFIEGFIARNRSSMLRMLAPLVALMNAKMRPHVQGGVLTIYRQGSGGLADINIQESVGSLADASARYRRHVEDSYEGFSTFPMGRLLLNGQHYRVSYNGRVWAGDPERGHPIPNDVQGPAFDPLGHDADGQDPDDDEDPDAVTPEKDAIVWAAFRDLVNQKRREFGMQEADEVTESMPFGGRSVGRIRDRGWGSEVAADKLTVRNREVSRRKVQQHRDRIGSGHPIAITLRHPTRRDLVAMVTASASEPGRYQLTWADNDGPSGHTTRDTPEAAVRHAIEEGYRLDTANSAEAREMVERVQQERERRAAEIESWLTESLPSPRHAGRMGDGFKVGEHVIRIGDMIKMEGQLGGYVASVDRIRGTAQIEQDNGETKTWPLASLLHDTKANRERQQEHNDKINAEAEARLELSLADWRAR